MGCRTIEYFEKSPNLEYKKGNESLYSIKTYTKVFTYIYAQQALADERANQETVSDLTLLNNLSLQQWQQQNTDKDPGPPVCEPPFCTTGGDINSPTLPENDIYFFHPDHLGSTSYITNIAGETVQFNTYMPFGESFVSQKRISVVSNYLFNSKEVDTETGLYYYGARYYNSKTSVWLSVDPLWEETMAPYNYAYQNPVKYIDPTGMYPIYGNDGEYLGDDGRSGDGDLAFVGERDDNGNFINLTQFTDNHTEFQISSNVVKHESTGDKDESLWIAHAANNAKDNNAIDWRGKNETLYDQLTDSDYSTTPSSARTPLGINDNSQAANNARAAVIDVLSPCGGNDPTNGAVLWDGTDLLAWGKSHNKFKEYKSIFISSSNLNKYIAAQKSKWGNNVKYRGIKYELPNSIFSGYEEKNFNYKTNSKGSYNLISTGVKDFQYFSVLF